MYIGVHYLTDVLAGAAIGIVITYYMYKWLSKKEDLSKIYFLILVVSLLSLVFVLIYYLFKAGDSSFDAQAYYFNTEAIAKMLGTLMGFVLGVKFENKYVNFSNHKDVLKNIIRFVLGVAIVFATRVILKEVFHLVVNPENLVDQKFLSVLASFLDFLRYAIMVLIGIGIYPILFKKIKI